MLSDRVWAGGHGGGGGGGGGGAHKEGARTSDEYWGFIRNINRWWRGAPQNRQKKLGARSAGGASVQGGRERTGGGGEGEQGRVTQTWQQREGLPGARQLQAFDASSLFLSLLRNQASKHTLRSRATVSRKTKPQNLGRKHHTSAAAHSLSVRRARASGVSGWLSDGSAGAGTMATPTSAAL